jgi:hypothetical protein
VDNRKQDLPHPPERLISRTISGEALIATNQPFFIINQRKTMSTSIKTVPTRDYEEVVSNVAKYAEGLRVGSVDGVAEAFPKDAVMYGFTMASCSAARSRSSMTLSKRTVVFDANRRLLTLPRS